MIEWFKNLSEGWQIALFGAGVSLIGGLFALLKWLFSKKTDSPALRKTIQKGNGNTAIIAEGNKAPTNIAERDIRTGIDGDNALNLLVSVSKEAGHSINEIKHLKEENEKQKDTISKLEEQLAQRQVMVGPGQQQTPQPTQEAKELAKLITQDDSPYAQALKAIAEGKTGKADILLNETQQIIDNVQERMNEAQAKIYIARMQNASYAGRPRDALQWCDKIKPLAGNNPLVLNEIAAVYYNNANYKEAEPLMKRTLAIDEASFGKDHPDVARDLNNLATLYIDTNRLSDAEPMMKRVVEIFEKSLGKYHPNVAVALNNLSQLYQATNRVSEAEPLMKRHLVILLQFTHRTGHPHPHLEDAVKNYTSLLMQMGHSEDEVSDRLNEILGSGLD